ncbi:hypothetical protein D3C77_186560 [compost metagenome]
MRVTWNCAGVILMSFLLFLPINRVALADAVMVDVKCPDSTIKYNVEKYSYSRVNSDGKHKIVTGGTPDTRISLSVVPVKTAGAPEGAPIGVGLAILVRKRVGESNVWNVTQFQNSFIPLDNIEEEVRKMIGEALM